MNLLLIAFGKFVSFTARALNKGNGSTWPGHIALMANKKFIRQTVKKNHLKIILVAGTNGKTTTSSMLKHILQKNGYRVIQNASGANLLNGIASTLIVKTNVVGKITADFAIFEVDENALPLVLNEITPDYLVLLNLFRDQLDRYGEVHTIADKWEKELVKLPTETTVILNADDPEIANLGNKTTGQTVYFGLDDQTKTDKQEHAADSIYCPNCHEKLHYNKRFFSHLGDWKCPKCGLRRPKIDIGTAKAYPLSGTYNEYNTHAAIALCKQVGVSEEEIAYALQTFQPAFGRQEIIEIEGKKVQIFLSKNPTGFNESLRTVKELNAKTVLFVLNDRIADGTDVSWIWDVDIDILLSSIKRIYVSGDRVYDMGLRVKYEIEDQSAKGLDPTPRDKSQKQSSKLKIIDSLEKAIKMGLDEIETNETLYILPTYTAMLETRKILTGKKIL